MVADVGARHREVEARGREAARGEPLRQAEQERRHALVGRRVVAKAHRRADVARHQPEELTLKSRQPRRERRHAREREPAQHHRVERDRVARIALAVDAVEADDLAGQVEAQDALVAVRVVHIRLHRAGTDRGDRVERIALAEHVLAGGERADVIDQHVELAQLARVDAFLEAGVRERAGRAELALVAVVGDQARVGEREDRPPGHRRLHRARPWGELREGERVPLRARSHARTGTPSPAPAGSGRSTSQCYARAGARATSPRCAPAGRSRARPRPAAPGGRRRPRSTR